MSIHLFAKRATARLKFESIHGWGLAVAAVRRNGISAYWYRDTLNFGDLITPLLLRHYGHTPVYERPAKAQLVATGSILEHLRNDYAGIILGSGFIDEATRLSFPNAKVLAVRGALTRERLGAGRKSVALGDPGLLASEVMRNREEKKYMLGIIPHYSANNSPVFGQLMVRLSHAATLIDVQNKPLAVFAAIDQCEHILSSSLHGLVVADSLGIPNRWLASANLWGGRFKFDDYYSGIGICAEPVTLSGGETLAELLALVQPTASERIQENKEALRSLWASLGQYM